MVDDGARDRDALLLAAREPSGRDEVLSERPTSESTSGTLRRMLALLSPCTLSA